MTSRPEISKPHPDTLRRLNELTHNLRAAGQRLGLTADEVAEAAGFGAADPDDQPWSPEDHANAKALGERITKARITRGLTVEGLGELVGLHSDVLCRIEGGVQDVRASTILELERVLGHSLV